MKAQKGGGGSYYGGSAQNSNKPSGTGSSMKKGPSMKSKCFVVKIDSVMQTRLIYISLPLTPQDTQRIDLEEKLSENLRSRMEEVETTKQRELAEKRYKQRIYSIPRKLARPVELINRLYEDPSTDLYSVLGVSKDVDGVQIKRIYRQLALVLHPDKNPHPEAKAAFDAIQDAYDTLSSPSKRSDYDKDLQRKARARRWTMKKLKQSLSDSVYNIKSRLLVLIYRMKTGKVWEEFSEVRKWWKEKVEVWKDTMLHLTLLPSLQDRLLFLHELYTDNMLKILSAIVGVSAVGSYFYY
jgi:hypothetical protein